MIYLDNSSTTKIAPEVLEAMMPYLKEEYGNPSSKYYLLAENAKKAVDFARQQVANLLHCDSDEVIFTSGATESNNFVLKGVFETYGGENSHIVTTRTEHPSVLETCRFLETKGVKVTYLEVDRFGRIDPIHLEKVILNDRPLLVSVIWGNNEVGSLNDLPTISEICLKYGVFLHTDATQVVGKIPIFLRDLPGIRFLSFSGHKIYGPKGIGVCYIRKEESNIQTRLTPLIHGGSQEFGYRSGTLAVHNIVGIGQAAELALKNIESHSEKLKKLDRTLTNILSEAFGEKIEFNNDQKDKVPGILSVRFKGKNNEVLSKKLSRYIAISTGSACSSGKPSHVLAAMGKTITEIRETIRFSLTPEIEVEDLNIFRQAKL
jgi:cysteine desulfurase